VSTVEPHDVIAKIASQACYQAGLGSVYQELLDFAGNEVYFAPAAALVGRTFGEALLACETSSVVGLVAAAGDIRLAPPGSLVIQAGDRVIAIAEDDDSLVFDRVVHGPPAAARPRPRERPGPARLLVVGWSALGARVLDQLRHFPDRPAVVDVLVDARMADGGVAVDSDDWAAVQFHRSADERAQLADLLVTGNYDHVLVLGYRDRLSAAQADAHTLLTLATIRHAIPLNRSPPRVVAEVVDVRNVDIAQAVGADDLVVSDRLSSLLIAQLAEASLMSRVFAELFDPSGCSVELRPAADYGDDATVFADVVVAASAWEEVAIGYRLATGEVRINPSKSALLTLSPADQVIVIVPPTRQQDREQAPLTT
jgi:hypothetical protein